MIQKISLTLLLCISFLCSSLDAKKKDTVNVQEVLTLLQKDPEYLKKNSDVAQSIIAQLSDPATADQIKADIEQIAQQDPQAATLLESKISEAASYFAQALQSIL